MELTTTPNRLTTTPNSHSLFLPRTFLFQEPLVSSVVTHNVCLLTDRLNEGTMYILCPDTNAGCVGRTAPGPGTYLLPTLSRN
jgi:hypothetical protein